MKNEIWKPVVGAEGKYSVSSLGRVRSEARLVPGGTGGWRPVPETMRVCAPNKYGYPIVDIYYPAPVGRKTRVVHQLVMESFVGPKPEDQVVCHENGDMSDNRLINLRYDTVLENNRDIARQGKGFSGRSHCPQGHLYDEVNTYWRKDRQGRECIACNRKRNRDRYRAAKGKKV
jgi:hypothetical protein